MTHRFFLFFTGLLSFFCLFAFPIQQLGSLAHILFASLLVLFVGIPHGAIDHKIFLSNADINNKKFYMLYFLAMGLGLLFWIILPQLSFLIFLMLSAFHFGQSQFASFRLNILTRNILYLSWGLSLLAGIIIYRFPELTELAKKSSDLALIYDSLNFDITKYVLGVSTGIATLLFLTFLIKGIWDLKIFLKEIILFGLLHCTFFLLPFIIGFIMYFTAFHAMSVLGQEYDYLKSQFKIHSIKQFIWLLAPYTLLSIFGLCLGIVAVHLKLLPISYIFLLIVFISILTIPHSFVMNTFYRKLKK